MREFESGIYSRGLETVYAAALMGNLDECISCIEDLVALTRSLQEAPAQRRLREELALVQRLVHVCLPEVEMKIDIPPAVALHRTIKTNGILADICGALFHSEFRKEDKILLRLSSEDGGLLPCCLSSEKDELLKWHYEYI